MAKRQGIIFTLRPVIESLEEVGFYLSDALKMEALSLVDE